MPVRSFRSAALATIIALPVLLPTARAFAGEYARFGNVPIVAEQAEGAPPVAPASGLLTLPSTWAPGGTAAVLVADPAGRWNGAHDRLVSNLIGAGIAVLELPLADQPEARLPILFGALLELADEVGASHLVVLGTEHAGQSEMDAAALRTPARRVGGRVPRFSLLGDLRIACRFSTDLRSLAAEGAVAGWASGEGGASCLHGFAVGRE